VALGHFDALARSPRALAAVLEAAGAAALRRVGALLAGRSAAHLEDARHIALATVSRVDALVSWNFKHIVNLDRVRGYNAVNFRFGYVLLEIRTTQEVLRYGQEEEGLRRSEDAA
jgi:hypothetical protein